MVCNRLLNILKCGFFVVVGFLLVSQYCVGAKVAEGVFVQRVDLAELSLHDNVGSLSLTQEKTLNIRSIAAKIETECLLQKNFDKDDFNMLQVALENIIKDAILWLEQSKNIVNRISFSNSVKANLSYVAKLVALNSRKNRFEVLSLARELQKIFAWDKLFCGRVLKHMDDARFWAKIYKVEDYLFKYGKIVGIIFGFMKFASFFKKNVGLKVVKNNALQTRVKDLEETIKTLSDTIAEKEAVSVSGLNENISSDHKLHELESMYEKKISEIEKNVAFFIEKIREQEAANASVSRGNAGGQALAVLDAKKMRELKTVHEVTLADGKSLALTISTFVAIILKGEPMSEEELYSHIVFKILEMQRDGVLGKVSIEEVRLFVMNEISVQKEKIVLGSHTGLVFEQEALSMCVAK